MHLVVGIEVNRLYISCAAGRCNRHPSPLFLSFFSLVLSGRAKTGLYVIIIIEYPFRCFLSCCSDSGRGYRGRAGRKENGESEQYGYGPEEAWESGDAGLEQRER